jgi:hypothetical protein
MSNFPCATASTTQKNLISMDREHCCLTVLLVMPTAVELLQLIGVGGWGWPISSSASLNIVACLQLRKRAPSLVSATEAAKSEECSVQLDGPCRIQFPSHEKISACTTVSVGFVEVRRIGVNVEDHVGIVESDCRIGMGGKVTEELFAFFHR